jgi:uncharacterized damage-inducible protein DinB
MSISKGVKEAWKVNTKVNKAIVDHLTPEMVHARTPGGGWSVAQHIAEIVGTPKHFGIKFAPQLESLPDLYEENPNDFIAETDLTRIREVAAQTAQAVSQALETATEKGNLPHTSVDMYVIHMMVHDAHHRGQLLLALKTNGFPLPSENGMWGPWKDE